MAYVVPNLKCWRCEVRRTNDWINATCWVCKAEIRRQEGIVGPIFGR